MSVTTETGVWYRKDEYDKLMDDFLRYRQALYTANGFLIQMGREPVKAKADTDDMSEWQPIETAPKDGSVIYLWDAHYRCRVTGAKWDFHYWMNGVSQGEKSWGAGDRDGPFCGKPTHWMPIPSPPSGDEKHG